MPDETSVPWMLDQPMYKALWSVATFASARAEAEGETELARLAEKIRERIDAVTDHGNAFR